MMKIIVHFFLLAFFAPLALGFVPSLPSVGERTSDVACLHMTKRFPAGRPCTVQADEDMAMWFEDKQGNVKKALTKPVGGRPSEILTKEQVAAIEKRGVNPFDRVKAYLEYFSKRPTRGY